MIISYTRFCSGMFRVFSPPSTCTIRCRGRHLISLICWLPTSKPKILIPFFLIGQRSGPYAYRNSEAPRPWEAVVGAAWIGQAVRQNYGVVGLLARNQQSDQGTESDNYCRGGLRSPSPSTSLQSFMLVCVSICSKVA